MATFDEAKCKAAIAKVCDDVEKTVETFRAACATVTDDFNQSGTAAGGVIGAAVTTAYTNYVEEPFGTLQASLANFRNRIDAVVANTVSGVSDLTGGLTNTTQQQ